MSKVHAEPHVESKVRVIERRGQLRALGLVVLCVLVVMGVFAKTFVEMVRIWGQSETYSHGYLVFPIFAYLVWQTQRCPCSHTDSTVHSGRYSLAVGGGFCMAARRTCQRA